MGANQSDLNVPRGEGVSAGPPGSMLLSIFDDRPAPPLPQELRGLPGPVGINREEIAAFINRNRRPEANPDHREEVFENDFVIPPVMANSTPEQRAYEARVLLRRNTPQVEELAAVQREFEMRQALAKRQLKAKIVLEQLWITETFIANELPLDEVLTVHEIFVKTHNNPHRLLKRAIGMVQLNNVRTLMKTARKFRSRIELLHEQMDIDAEQPIDMGGWREVGDEDGPQYFINEEGLIRLDAPTQWYAEEDERERRIQRIDTEIKNVEEFVVARVNKLLEEIHKEKTMCRTLLRKIGKALEKDRLNDADKESLIDARGLVEGVVEKITAAVLDFFYYEPPRFIPGIPLFGVTNAYAQRRNRENPNYRAELEEYFNAPEENEQVARDGEHY